MFKRFIDFIRFIPIFISDQGINHFSVAFHLYKSEKNNLLRTERRYASVLYSPEKLSKVLKYFIRRLTMKSS